MPKHSTALPKTGLRKFTVRMTVEVTLELEQRVLDAVDDEWRSRFYRSVVTENDVAKHLAYNVVANNADLSDLDGFADLPDSAMKVEQVAWEDIEVL